MKARSPSRELAPIIQPQQKNTNATEILTELIEGSLYAQEWHRRDHSTQELKVSVHVLIQQRQHYVTKNDLHDQGGDMW